MTNRELKHGEEVFRYFGPEGTTHGEKIGKSYPGGKWWGLGAAPKTAREWREKAAVLDEFNRDGYLVIARINGKTGPKAVVGAVAEQAGEKLPGQYLPGGATQAFFVLDNSVAAQLEKMGAEVVTSGKPTAWTDPTRGIAFRILPTGWTDANGVWGYLEAPGVGTVQTARLGAREEAAKDSREVLVTP